MSVAPAPSPAANPNNNNKELLFKSCASFIDCRSERNNAQLTMLKTFM